MSNSHWDHLRERLVAIDASRHRRFEASRQEYLEYIREEIRQQNTQPRQPHIRRLHHSLHQAYRRHNTPQITINIIMNTVGIRVIQAHDANDMPHLWCPCMSCSFMRYNDTIHRAWALEQIKKYNNEAGFWRNMWGGTVLVHFAAVMCYFAWKRALASASR